MMLKLDLTCPSCGGLLAEVILGGSLFLCSSAHAGGFGYGLLWQADGTGHQSGGTLHRVADMTALFLAHFIVQGRQVRLQDDRT
jgi:hypothetical protein